jgi:glucose-1-phosphate thymidylyltransferase
MAMRIKGVAVILEAASPHSNRDAPATECIANRPIACHALESLAAAGVEGLAVVAPANVIDNVRTCVETEIAAAIDVTYLPQRGRMDLLGALRAAAQFVGEDSAIVHFADGLLAQQLDLAPEILGEDLPDLLLLLHRSGDSREGLAPATQRLLGVSELNGSRNHLALAGVCRFGPGALKRVTESVQDLGCEVDLIAIAQHLAAEGRTLEAAIVSSWRRYRGDPRDLLELNRIALDQQAAQGEPLDRGDNRIEGRVIIDPSADVTSSIILGPCIIGRHARVTSSYIGPYTSIGAGAEIEGAEIVRSIVSEDVRIMHISGRIEGSTIGRRASIFRDFGLPRAVRLHVGEGVEVALDC